MKSPKLILSAIIFMAVLTVAYFTVTNYSKIFFTDPDSKLFFLKQIIAGMFITLTMTGMDQEMMQKSISVKTLKDSQKNMVVLGFIMLVVIFLFLFLGGLLHLFASSENISATG